VQSLFLAHLGDFTREFQNKKFHVSDLFEKICVFVEKRIEPNKLNETRSEDISDLCFQLLTIMLKNKTPLQ
jgi:hypothetical protein